MAFKPNGQTVLRALDVAAYAGGRGDSVSRQLSASVNMSMNAKGLSARDSAASSTNAFLVSELEKRDPLVRQPLTAYTWPDNIPVRTGGGWDEFLSNLTVDYGSAGDDDDANVAAGGADVMPVIQPNLGKDIYKTHLFIQPVAINEFDMLRQQITGRSIDKICADGVRLHYDKHMDKNVFVGLTRYGTTGLLNNPNVTAELVAQGAATGSPRDWAHKTSDEILADVNSAIMTVWAASGNDMSAIPNHVLLPFAQYNDLISRKASEYADKSIMDFLMANNIANKHGEGLVFGVSLWGTGIGTGGADRMAVYRHDERFIAVDELQPLTRMRTVYSSRHFSYDTNYAANISEVEVFYPSAIGYFDGI